MTTKAVKTTKKIPAMIIVDGAASTGLTAKNFIEDLYTYQSPGESKKLQRFFKDQAGEDEFVGVRMGDVFALAKHYIQMLPAEIERLLESNLHEARVGG